MKSTILSFVSLLFATFVPNSRGQSVIEISGESRNLLADVEFYSDSAGAKSLGTGKIVAKDFQWFDLPAGTTFARIKIAELASDFFELPKTPHVLVKVGLPKVVQSGGSLPRATLDLPAVEGRVPARPGAIGWLYFGQLEKEAPSTPSTWRSLYFVRNDKDNPQLDFNNKGDFDTVKKAALDSVNLRINFPLYLRSTVVLDSGNWKIIRNASDEIVRAGQYVKIKEISQPDISRNVWAQVEILSPPVVP